MTGATWRRVRVDVLAMVLGILVAVWLLSPAPAPRETSWGPVRLSPEQLDQVLPAATPQVQRLYRMTALLAPLYAPASPVAPHDWRERHPEAGQTFKEYLAYNPFAPMRSPAGIAPYVLGELGDADNELARAVFAFTGACLSLPVDEQRPLSLAAAPESARRVHPSWGDRQVLTTYLLGLMLADERAGGVRFRVGVTGVDVWPGEGWNYLFGQALPRRGAALFSLHRLARCPDDPDPRRTTFLRSLKVATHETGHLFAIDHCTEYECGMAGTNRLEELDRHPLLFCPECAAKVCFARSVDPVVYFRALAARCAELGLEDEAALCARSAEVMSR